MAKLSREQRAATHLLHHFVVPLLLRRRILREDF